MLETQFKLNQQNELADMWLVPGEVKKLSFRERATEIVE